MLGIFQALLGKTDADSGNEPGEEDVAEVEVQETRIEAAAEPPVSESGPSPTRRTEWALFEGELRAARKIQKGLAPKTFPPIPGCPPFDLYALLDSAREIGGDFYDFWLNGRDNLMMVIGDVARKGIPAALFMAVCRTYIRAFSRSAKEPAKLLEVLNNELSRNNESGMFATLVCAVVNIPSGAVAYANAGHPPPFLRRRDGSVKVLDLGSNPPVGFMSDAEYETRRLRLEPGDGLLLYTDGMTECLNDAGRILGEKEALELFRSSSGGGCRTALGQLRSEVSEFAGGAQQADDITLMMYGQLDQDTSPDLGVDRDFFGDLDDDPGVFSLSNPRDPLPTPSPETLADNLGIRLSGLVE